MLRLGGAAALFVLTGCGAKVVLEDDGAGGSGSTSASTSAKTGSMKSTGTAASCTDLEQSFQNAVGDAAACNPAVSSLQCTVIIDDTCGCPTIALNEKLGPLVYDAKVAYETWVEEGCGPYPCTQCVPADIGYCEPLPDGGGICKGSSSF